MPMTITTLVENTTTSADLGCEHGLSLYIETGSHRLLFDTGAGTLFAENAVRMGVDVASVDVAVLSHGHYDHGGGIGEFLRINHRARMYVHRRAFEGHYASRPDGSIDDIGIDRSLVPNDRFVLTDDYVRIDDELELFSAVHGDRFVPSGNASLLVRSEATYRRDDFAHEQNLAITVGGRTVLISGCAHAGIVNIVEHYRALAGAWPNVIVGGFHLSNRSAGGAEDAATVARIGAFLLGTGAMCYTGHCTGAESYGRLKATMGERIEPLSTGRRFVV